MSIRRPFSPWGEGARRADEGGLPVESKAAPRPPPPKAPPPTRSIKLRHARTCCAAVRLRRPSPPPVTKAGCSSRMRGEGDASAVWTRPSPRALQDTTAGPSRLDASGGGVLAACSTVTPTWNAIGLRLPGWARCEGCDRQSKPVAFRPPPCVRIEGPPSMQGEENRCRGCRIHAGVFATSAIFIGPDESNWTAVHLLRASSPG